MIGHHAKRARAKQREERFADFTEFCWHQRQRVYNSLNALSKHRIPHEGNVPRGAYGEAMIFPEHFDIEVRA